jgi:hypothetical protein
MEVVVHEAVSDYLDPTELLQSPHPAVEVAFLSVAKSAVPVHDAGDTVVE